MSATSTRKNAPSPKSRPSHTPSPGRIKRALAKHPYLLVLTVLVVAAIAGVAISQAHAAKTELRDLRRIDNPDLADVLLVEDAVTNAALSRYLTAAETCAAQAEQNLQRKNGSGGNFPPPGEKAFLFDELVRICQPLLEERQLFFNTIQARADELPRLTTTTTAPTTTTTTTTANETPSTTEGTTTTTTG